MRAVTGLIDKNIEAERRLLDGAIYWLSFFRTVNHCVMYGICFASHALHFEPYEEQVMRLVTSWESFYISTNYSTLADFFSTSTVMKRGPIFGNWTSFQPDEIRICSVLRVVCFEEMTLLWKLAYTGEAYGYKQGLRYSCWICKVYALCRCTSELTGSQRRVTLLRLERLSSCM
jgi:hypothetical protein